MQSFVLCNLVLLLPKYSVFRFKSQYLVKLFGGLFIGIKSLTGWHSCQNEIYI